ncbi:MAG: thioredoxin family protein [Turicibacter sp.]|nr:thioredoxin family protein [Turicibacter sp.]
MKEIKSVKEFEEAKGKKSVMMFTAGWCPDCVAVKPVLPDIVSNFPDYEFYSVNRDEFIDLCQDLNIFGIPSFVAYENNLELGRLVNKDRKTQEEIETFIKGL